MSGEDVPDLRTGQAHSARVYDYLLGGKDNYAADRAAGEAALQVFPNARVAARVNREFMHRAVRTAAESGVRQFLDVGTGIPTPPNLHQVAQEIDPACRVVYVDNDPIVLAHAAALMTSVPGGRTAYVQADATDPEAVLAAPDVRDTLDLDRPVALSLIAILHFIDDDDVARAMVRGILDRLAPGSFLILTHATLDISPEAISGSLAAYRSAGIGSSSTGSTSWSPGSSSRSGGVRTRSRSVGWATTTSRCTRRWPAGPSSRRPARAARPAHAPPRARPLRPPP